jgi:DNA-binding response OmpR family regulator
MRRLKIGKGTEKMINQDQAHKFKMMMQIPESYRYDLDQVTKIAIRAMELALPQVNFDLMPLTKTQTSKSNESLNVVWHSKRSALVVNGIEQRLNRVEEVIMDRLTITPNEYVSYPELLAILQTEAREIRSANSLRVHLHRLRKKIGDVAIIHTDKEFGYSLRTHDGRVRIVL